MSKNHSVVSCNYGSTLSANIFHFNFMSVVSGCLRCLRGASDSRHQPSQADLLLLRLTISTFTDEHELFVIRYLLWARIYGSVASQGDTRVHIGVAFCLVWALG